MFNQVTLIGRIVRDPVIYTTKEGKSVTTITLAVRRSYKNSKGEYDTDFIPCTAWDKLAETSSDYCTKGSLVCITGRIQMRQIDYGENQRNSFAEIIAESICFLHLKKATPPPTNEVPIPGEDQAPPPYRNTVTNEGNAQHNN